MTQRSTATHSNLILTDSSLQKVELPSQIHEKSVLGLEEGKCNKNHINYRVSFFLLTFDF